MTRSTKMEKARQLNAARGLLQRPIALPEAVRRLSREFDLSERQAYRYLEPKLAHAYEILVPCREHRIGVRVTEFDDEDGSNLRKSVVRAATRGEHDREPDGVADRVRQEPRSGGTQRMGLRR